MTEHTTECEAARAGHLFRIYDLAGRPTGHRGEPDPYPMMGDLTTEQRADILACPHVDHDVVRIFCQVSLP